MKGIALVLAALIALAGCGSPGNDGNPQHISVIDVDVNGKTVTCVLYSGVKRGGLSCDFEGSTADE